MAPFDLFDFKVLFSFQAAFIPAQLYLKLPALYVGVCQPQIV